MLSEILIRSSKQLQNLELQDYKKVINYSINLILNHENQTKLHQFIQIQEDKGDQITNICLSIIEGLVKYRTGTKQFQGDLSILLLSKERKQYLREKLLAQLYQLRKIIYAEDLENITKFKDLQWRFQIEVASKTNKNTFIPNIFMNLSVEQQGISKKTAFNCDFSNLKNLHQSLQQAMKMHSSSKYKAARNSSV